MPDWSYHTIFKPVLSLLPSAISREIIHKSMNSLSKVPFGPNMIEFLGHLKTDHSLEHKIHQLNFQNQIALSSIIDPNLSGTNAFMNLGFGLIEIGPITLDNSFTSKSPLINLKKDQVIGYEENTALQLDEAIDKLSKLNKKTPIFARILGSFEDFKIIESKISHLVDYFVMNKELTSDLFINKWDSSLPICLSVQPHELCDFKVNCTYDSILIEENPSLTDMEQKEYLISAMNRFKTQGVDKPIFTKGGVIQPIDAIDILNEGAKLVFLTHGYIISGPGLPKRINEVLLFNRNKSVPSSNGWLWYFLFGLLMFVGGVLALLISLTTIILPYDEHFLKTTSYVILQFNSKILPFMSHDRMTLAGTIMSGGILFMSLAYNGIKHNYHWAKKATDVSGIVGFLAIFLFIGFGYFDWLHALFWLVLIPPFLIGFFKTKQINRSPESQNLTNHTDWKSSLIGQLFCIMLGFSIILGGCIISYVGITTTFVQTDLNYLCISPSQMNAFNQNLIPVISHDRAGFGGGLISVGLLILMISLWGFRQHHKWIWWTLFLSGMPAFITAFGVHFMIGYTNFFHLLPPIIAMTFLLIGLVKSYQFLNIDQKR
ncbi:dihydroorotate dehydrogenase [Gottfriedia luciferensis]|uniref:dihydroorotate dehydrogenase n=1 Tax=Gottfriedia luciferensis TaxID=178774 RepID=UPI000B42DD81|nr:dihydroorotate dehydrogenase [Gottfriedia luciferensis]